MKNYIKKICLSCKKNFSPTGARQSYCNPKCRLQYRSILKKCFLCQDVFLDKTEGHKLNFCSDKCRGKHRTHDKVEKVCKWCNICFSATYIKKNQQFCSVSCLNKFKGNLKTKNGTIGVICDDCGNNFIVSKSRYKKGNVKYCSRKCLNKNLVGEGNPFYGKFHNPSTKFGGGRCKWYTHIKPDEVEIKCQGTWELAFAKWLDKNQLEYETHKGRIPYVDKNGVKRNYYPDFYVHAWSQFVDIKNDYLFAMQKDKFECISLCNPDKDIRILLKEELDNLGVFSED